MKKFKGVGEVEIIINPADWKDAKALKKAIEREIVASGVQIDDKKDLTSLIPALLQVDGSEAFDAALWPCLARCTRGGDKITEKTFDDAAARADYYDIVSACVEENLGPLVKSLLLLLSATGILQSRQKGEPPASESTMTSSSSPPG